MYRWYDAWSSKMLGEDRRPVAWIDERHVRPHGRLPRTKHLHLMFDRLDDGVVAGSRVEVAVYFVVGTMNNSPEAESRYTLVLQSSRGKFKGFIASIPCTQNSI